MRSGYAAPAGAQYAAGGYLSGVAQLRHTQTRRPGLDPGFGCLCNAARKPNPVSSTGRRRRGAFVVRATISFAILVAAVGAQPAWACRVPIPSARFRVADIVVDGVAFCLKSGECRLTILHVRKGQLKRAKHLRIVVDDAPPLRQAGPSEIIFGRCPHTFEPTEAISKGRFYLRIRSDGSLYAFVPPDLQETEN
jgi:hypothetical protein